MTEFGKKIRLTIYDPSSNSVDIVLENLRIDFDLNVIPTFARGSISVYGLNNDTVKELTSAAKGRAYVKIETSLHGSPYETLFSGLAINNTLAIKKVPEKVFMIYVAGGGQRILLDGAGAGLTTIGELTATKLFEAPLRQYVDGALKNISPRWLFEFIGVPESVLNQRYRFSNTTEEFEARFLEVIREIEEVSDTICYIEDVEERSPMAPLGVYKFYFVANPETTNLSDELVRASTVNQIELQSNELKDIPKIGVAQMSFKARLSNKFRFGKIVNTSSLITASTDPSEQGSIELAKNFLSSHVVGPSVFVVLTVRHKGSNYTNAWESEVVAYRGADGEVINDYGWFGR